VRQIASTQRHLYFVRLFCTLQVAKDISALEKSFSRTDILSAILPEIYTDWSISVSYAHIKCIFFSEHIVTIRSNYTTGTGRWKRLDCFIAPGWSTERVRKLNKGLSVQNPLLLDLSLISCAIDISLHRSVGKRINRQYNTTFLM